MALTNTFSSASELEIVQQPHKPLPIQVWLGVHLLAELPDQETLLALRRSFVLQRLRARMLQRIGEPTEEAAWQPCAKRLQG